ncbi:MAG: twin-arginine translocase TatA/TatE family subunit [Balneolaceae bacterium]|nr:twin-arginine translocase TatA/TatE family subunit [Balneolaceae bacterium]
MFSGIGTTEILIIAILVLVLFGAKRIPELARGLGQGIQEFKQASKDIKKEIDESSREINDAVNQKEENNANK